MPMAGENCGRSLNHTGRCLTAEAYARKIQRDGQVKRERVSKRQKLLDEYKTDQGCIDCGYNKDARALDFDHTDPSLKYQGISEMVSNRSWAKILEEVAKCEIRCSNCHRIKTFRRNDETPANR